MHGHHDDHIEIRDPGPVGFNGLLKGLCATAAVLGAFLVADGFVGDKLLAWQGLLHGYMFFLMLALGGLVFTCIQYVATAKWSVAIRRFAEGMCSNWILVPSFVVFAVIVLFGYDTLYALDSPVREALGKGGLYFQNSDADLVKKGWFLSQPVVLGKGILFYAFWGGMAWMIRRNSETQDRTKDASLKKTNVKLSIAFLIVFAYTFSVHCIDMVMALEAKWFSTMFGVYCFAGLFLSTLATLTLIVHAFRRVPTVRPAVTQRHVYDMGTWMMAFSCFMMYIGFSQYMLIWYANLPEETFYFIARSQGGWGNVFVALPFLKWVVPFCVLMPQPFRTNARVHVFVCLAVLLGQWLDIYWLIFPVFNETPVFPGTAAIGASLLLLGVFGLALDQSYRRRSVLATGDPHFAMSVSGSYL